MRGTWWVAALVAAASVTVLAPSGGAAETCEDTRESRSGALKWAVLSAVFSASTAIATRTVDLEDQGGVCVPVTIHCEALAADGSHLSVTVQQGVGSYHASFKGLLAFNDGTATCGSIRAFEGSDGAIRALFEG